MAVLYFVPVIYDDILAGTHVVVIAALANCEFLLPGN